MTGTHTQNGVTYVERNYKCLDCDWAWNQICVKGDATDTPSCPNCKGVDKNRFIPAGKNEKIKSKVAKKRPKDIGIDWDNPKINYRTQKQTNLKKAAGMAYEEAQKQGFTDMRDSGLRNGDICAPPLNSLVSTVQDKVFGGGWSGGTAPQYAGANPVDAGGKAALGALQGGIINGKVRDPLNGVGNYRK